MVKDANLITKPENVLKNKNFKHLIGNLFMKNTVNNSIISDENSEVTTESNQLTTAIEATVVCNTVNSDPATQQQSTYVESTMQAIGNVFSEASVDYVKPSEETIQGACEDTTSLLEDISDNVPATIESDNDYTDLVNGHVATESHTEMSQEMAIIIIPDITSEDNSASNLTPENSGVVEFYTPHPDLQDYPSMNEAERTSVDLNMAKTKKMLDPALVFGNRLLSNVYQYQKAIEMGYEVKVQKWAGKVDEIPALLEEIEFFRAEKNSTQRGIWAYKKLDNFRKVGGIQGIKQNVKGAKNQKYDSRAEAARFYHSSIGYISKATTYDTKHPELYALLYSGVFEFTDADKIIKFKQENPEFYSDLVNKVVLVDDINKYKKYLTKDNTLYRMIKTNTVTFEQASKLLEIQDNDNDSFEQFINGEISLDDIDATLKRVKEQNIKSDDAESSIDDEEHSSKTSDDISEITEASVAGELAEKVEQLTVQNLPISPKVRNRIIDLAAVQHKSVDEFLAELLDSYQSSHLEHNRQSEGSNG